jgi:hypothetical protein
VPASIALYPGTLLVGGVLGANGAGASPPGRTRRRCSCGRRRRARAAVPASAERRSRSRARRPPSGPQGRASGQAQGWGALGALFLS